LATFPKIFNSGSEGAGVLVVVAGLCGSETLEAIDFFAGKAAAIFDDKFSSGGEIGAAADFATDVALGLE